MNKFFDIKDNVAIITGAFGGIGAGVAKLFSEAGAKLALVDKRTSTASSEFSKNHQVIEADIQNEEELDGMVEKVAGKWGRIDILVNCAGVNVRKPIDRYTSDEWDSIMNINLKAVFVLTNKVAGLMKEKSYGRIINIGSIQGVTCWNGNGSFSLAPYQASKSGLIAITKSFALELAKHGITVNAVLPAFVDTPLVKPVKDNGPLYRDIVRRTPVGRFATISEIAFPVLFLASKESSYITGHSLLADGGWTIE